MQTTHVARHMNGHAVMRDPYMGFKPQSGSNNVRSFDFS